MTDSTPYEEGDPNAPICLIGEAPSTWELRENKPFVGPAGMLLEKLLHSAQISRRDCYIVNVFEDQIVKPRDDAGKIFSRAQGTINSSELLWTSTKGFTTAGQERAANCLRRVRESKANVIVPLGAPAMHLVMNDTRSIAKWRGSIVEGIDGRKVIGTIHPSACLQGAYEWRYLISSDLRRVRKESTTLAIRLSPRRSIVDPSFDDAIDYLRLCQKKVLVDTDIELLGGQIDCFSLAFDPKEAMSIPLIDGDWGTRWTEEQEAMIWLEYAKIISDPEIAKVNQNITFDLSVLMLLNKIVPRGVMHDPMVGHSIMYPFLDKKLGVICSLYTEEPYYKDDGEITGDATVKDFKRRWEYNAKDASVALESWLVQEPLINAIQERMLVAGGKESFTYRDTYDLTMRLVPALLQMMVDGVALNERELLAARNRLEDLLKIKAAELTEAFGRPILIKAPKTVAEKRAAEGALNVNSPAQLIQYFYTEKKLRPYLNSIGKVSVDDKALARIVRRDNSREAKLVQEWRALAKMKSTYLDISYDADRRLRASYNIRGTWAGRLSSKQSVFGRGLNMQNLPVDFRAFIEADPDDKCA